MKSCRTILGTAFLLALTLIQTGCVGLTGASSPGDVTFSPTKVDFGQVAAGSKKTVTVTLSNTGSVPITVPQATLAGSTYSMSGLTLPATLAPNDVLTFSASFAPTVPGTSSGTLIVSSDNPSVSPASLALTGTGLNPSGPTILTQPTSQSVTIGQSANFSVTATGTGTLSYQWKKNGSTISGATAASYTTPAAVTSDSGSPFTVTVTDSVGTVTSNAATLTVTATPLAPSITTQPSSATVTAGQTATFSVTAGGTSPLSYQWRKSGANISGATASTYTTPVTTSADSGAPFSVVVTNAAGSVTSSAATLTVNTPVTITSQPVSQTVTAGQTATFSVSASGTFSMTYQWRKNGVNITGATAASYTTPVTTTADSGAQFSVLITSLAGSVTSNSATLTVTAVPVAPSITTQPASRTVTAGQTASFSVTASGTSPLSYQWRKNGASIGGATASSYTTPATTVADNGALFSVVVTNSVGSATSSAATLTVNTSVSITSQPVSQTVTAGQTASFSVTATGTAPVSYQWTKNGANISGATASSYTTPATTAADNGAQFTVVVSNSVGNATSNAATLTVNALTTQLVANPTSLSFGNVHIGSGSALTVALTNSGNSNITISNVSVTGAGFNASGVSSGQILAVGQSAQLNVTFASAAIGSATGSVTITSNASNSPATISLTGTGTNQIAMNTTAPNCGLSGNSSTIVPGDADWHDFATTRLPAAGGTYNDSAYGLTGACTVTRLTNSLADTDTLGHAYSNHHYYSTKEPFSAGDTKYMTEASGRIIDLQGREIVSDADMGAANCGHSMAIWDRTDDMVFWCANSGTNTLSKCTISSNAPGTTTINSGPGTVSCVVDHTFAGYANVNMPDETDETPNGWFAMAGSSGGTIDVFMYQPSTGTVGAPYHTPCSGSVDVFQPGGNCIHKLESEPDDGVLMRLEDNGSNHEVRWAPPFTAPQDTNCVNGYSTLNFCDHIDNYYDLSGNLVGAQDLNANAGCAGHSDGLPAVNLVSETMYCLFANFSNGSNPGGSTSANSGGWELSSRDILSTAGNQAGRPWLVYSAQHDTCAEYWNGSSNYCAPSTYWKQYDNEILMVRADANNDPSKIYRLAWAHSRIQAAAGGDSYFYPLPRAAISRDGKYIAFESNAACGSTGSGNGCNSPRGIFSSGNQGDGYGDVYLIGPLF